MDGGTIPVHLKPSSNLCLSKTKKLMIAGYDLHNVLGLIFWPVIRNQMGYSRAVIYVCEAKQDASHGKLKSPHLKYNILGPLRLVICLISPFLDPQSMSPLSFHLFLFAVTSAKQTAFKLLRAIDRGQGTWLWSQIQARVLFSHGDAIEAFKDYERHGGQVLSQTGTSPSWHLYLTCFMWLQMVQRTSQFWEPDKATETCL